MTRAGLHVPAGPTRSLLSAAAAAGLLPFARTDAGTNRVPLLPVNPGAAATAAATAAAGAALRAAKRITPTDGNGRDKPKQPSGPPGNTGAGGVAGSSGGVASGVWCAVLICCALYLAAELRRLRIRPAVATPSGVLLLLQRPG